MRRRFGALFVVPTLVLAACGGSDDDASPAAESSTESATDAPDAAGAGSDTGTGTDTDTDTDTGTDTGDGASDGSAIGDGEAPIQVGEDGTMEFSDELDDAISSLGTDTMMGIVADQLDPSPEVSIDGDAVTFTFGEGSVSGSWLPCSVAQSFLSDGQTLKVVYPDGDTMC